MSIFGVLACERGVEELRTPSGGTELETWCQSSAYCIESAQARCPEGVVVVASSTDEDEGVCRIRFRCVPGAVATPVECPLPSRHEEPPLREVERRRTIGIEASAGLGVAPSNSGRAGPLAALELAAVYRVESALGVALAGGIWPTGGTCTKSGPTDSCDFPVWARVAPQGRWYFAHTTKLDASLIGEVGLLLADHYNPVPLVGGGPRLELVLGPALLGTEIRGGPALATPKPAPYVVVALSLGTRIRLGE
jgi:hypothetical protein